MSTHKAMKTTMKMTCTCGFSIERPIKNTALTRVMVAVMELRSKNHVCIPAKVSK